MIAVVPMSGFVACSHRRSGGRSASASRTSADLTFARSASKLRAASRAWASTTLSEPSPELVIALFPDEAVHQGIDLILIQPRRIVRLASQALEQRPRRIPE